MTTDTGLLRFAAGLWFAPLTICAGRMYFRCRVADGRGRFVGGKDGLKIGPSDGALVRGQ